jgi:hypothetical protein
VLLQHAHLAYIADGLTLSRAVANEDRRVVKIIGAAALRSTGNLFGHALLCAKPYDDGQAPKRGLSVEYDGEDKRPKETRRRLPNPVAGRWACLDPDAGLPRPGVTMDEGRFPTS